MTFSRMHLWLAGAVVLLPAMVRAQTDPANPGAPGPGASSNTSQSPGLHSSLPRSGSDSSLNDASGGDAQVLRDKMFLRKAGLEGLAHIQLGELAAKKAASEDVKKYGQKMVDDHTKLNADFTPIAESMGVVLPKKLNKPDQQEYDKLSGLTGADFDKEYLAYVTRDHQKDLHDFEMEAAATSDPTLKEAVTNAQVMVSRHLRWVVKLDGANGVPVTIATK